MNRTNVIASAALPSLGGPALAATADVQGHRASDAAAIGLPDDVETTAAEHPRRTSRLRLAALTWAGVYPVLTGAALLLDPWIRDLPIPIRTLAMSALMVPTMVFAVTPIVTKAFRAWLNA
ncbi:MAG: hypothetical protein AAGM38_01430 [Pseudomonadota bacterium]